MLRPDFAIPVDLVGNEIATPRQVGANNDARSLASVPDLRTFARLPELDQHLPNEMAKSAPGIHQSVII